MSQRAVTGLTAPHGASLVTRRNQLATIAGVLGLVVLVAVIASRIAQQGYLNHVSGSWAALADDFAHGVFYRPVISDVGYGGTRNFPLHFVLHGALVRLGLSLLTAGYVLSVASAAALVWGGATGLMSGGASPRIAWAGGILALASRAAVMGAAGIRGDLLPVALGVVGLALFGRRQLLLAAIFLGLGMVAKPTLAWAPAAAALAALVTKDYKSVLTLSVLVGLVVAVCLLGASWSSHGEMLKSFAMCASGGGFSLATLKNGLSYARPGDFAWVAGGVLLTLVRGRRALAQPFCVAALLSVPATLFILTSRGTHVNHLVDACVVGALAVASALGDVKLTRRLPEVVFGIAASVGLLEVVLLDGMQMRQGELAAAVAALPHGRNPILSEQPWVPLLAGERAFVLDSYNLLLIREKTAAMNRDLLDRLDRQEFRALVLLGRVDQSSDWYNQMQFGPGFREHVEANYVLAGVFGAHAQYLPRKRDAAVSSPPLSSQEETVLERTNHPNKVRAWLTQLVRN